MKVLVLGTGQMMEGILRGWMGIVDFKDWTLYSPSGVSSQRLASLIGAQWTDKPEDVKGVEWMILGCKPQQLSDVGSKFHKTFNQSTVLSLLAAVDEADQRRILGVERLVRVMPNLGVKFKKGISLISSSSAPSELPKIQELFAHLGLSLIVKETELEELTLLTGSGPAFFYELALNLSKSFTSLDEDSREKLAKAVLSGAGITADQDPRPLRELTSSVTSKGGVTIAVLEKWRESGLMKVVKDGIERGKARTFEIKDLLRKS
jgi:pyrroline-5-carboxylate reductase